ncbi:phage/plasmid primase, P4 family [Methanococcoides sp. AM1]|uniref:DNA primase family protein n=1 Tax=Methanococcoides sp. AM1 TaxID=1201011 RepID=UPI0014384F0D|nr:DNA primase family protein [Methanococcoides sp. AM1]
MTDNPKSEPVDEKEFTDLAKNPQINNAAKGSKPEDGYKDIGDPKKTDVSASFMLKTSNSDLQFVIGYDGKNFQFYAKYKDELHPSFVKIKADDLFSYNKKRTMDVANYIAQITEGNIEGRNAKSIADVLMNKLGNEHIDNLNELIKAYNKRHQRSLHDKGSNIDIKPFCKHHQLEETLGKKMLETGINIVNDGATEDYVASSLEEKYKVSSEAAFELADILMDMRYAEIINSKPSEYFLDEKKNIDVPLLASDIRKFYRFLTVGKSGKKDIYVYRNGVYVNDGVEVIRWMVNRLLQKYVKEKDRSEALRFIEDETQIERSELNNDAHLINLTNGLYDINNGQFIPHTPDVYSTIRIPVKYNPDADCPMVKKFMSEVVSEEDAQTLIEYSGYCLIPDTKLQKALMLYGNGRNGKSIFLLFLEDFIGEHNISGVSLQKLDKDKFSVARLFGKLVNISPDIPSHRIYSDSTFKMLVGGDKIHGEQKYKDSFEFENTARLIFSANNLPPIEDGTYAYYRRWLLIPFPNTFDGKKEDKNLLQKLCTPEEMSGFLNLALEGLHRILKNNKFTYEKSPEDIEKTYRANINSVETFLEDCVVFGSNGLISKQEMYEKFKEWCTDNCAIPIKYNAFCKKLKNEGVQDHRINDDSGNKVSYWTSVSFKGVNISQMSTPKKLNLKICQN